MSQPIFVFKVALAGRKSIWRRIALRGNQTLDDLHEAIYDAFDRDDEHLYSFSFPAPGRRSLAGPRCATGVEYVSPNMLEFDGPFSDPDLPNAAKTQARRRLSSSQTGFLLFVRLWRRVVARDHGRSDRRSAREGQVSAGAGISRQVPAAVPRRGRRRMGRGRGIARAGA